ncbi:zinc/iron-chelating domain-containing protein [Nonlabens spongiae]|uniref:Zinc/iron-chelating domain-containing protein n=1 Tax=Nonlabens spongiae TaxID=331648 RepID=A0A1W6MNQ7_9FLAO|nr:YkgJ family cysteine cluster protein [Nonlabens spongiae]ARN79231.1 zinc/iron-chelating domain-containing protein [Nonlabens spongiae]
MSLLENLENKARQKESENRAFFKRLKKKKPKDLDLIAREEHDSVFDEIDCLECANCCKTTGPLFTDNDINRIAKHFKMRPADFVDQYLKVDEEGDYILQSTPCHFLGSDNYCSIYEVRPKACREYPHTDRRKLYQIGNLSVKNTHICPAALEIVERIKERMK